MLGNDALAIRAPSTSEHAVAGLVGILRWRSSDGDSKLSAEYKRARRLRLVLALGLQYLCCVLGCEDVSEKPERRGPGAKCTSIRSSSEPGASLDNATPSDKIGFFKAVIGLVNN
ncbi:hypothetical protein EDB87DRAFT_1580122 [Lactarius vividus]|nr:hypothetical protein EDB87DRAFT_1580122 [Lactarius vividus]